MLLALAKETERRLLLRALVQLAVRERVIAGDSSAEQDPRLRPASTLISLVKQETTIPTFDRRHVDRRTGVCGHVRCKAGERKEKKSCSAAFLHVNRQLAKLKVGFVLLQHMSQMGS